MGFRYDPTAGKLVADGAVVVEDHGIPKKVLDTGNVPMLKPDGTPVFVATETLQDAINEGYQYETPEAEAHRKEAAEYDNPLAAGALGAARGASLGLSDVAASGLGFADAVRKYKEHNPISSTAGEITGMVAPALATGGTATIAEAGSAGLTRSLLTKTPAGFASKIGQRSAAKLAQNVAKESALKQAGATAAGMAVEGALYGAGSGVSELALQEEPITSTRAAEALISGIGVGALFGGGLSLGVSGVGAAARGTGSKLKSLFKKGQPVSVEAIEAPKGYGLDEMDDFFDDIRASRASNVDDLERAFQQEGVTPTPADLAADTMEGRVFKGLEDSLAQDPTAFGLQVEKNVVRRNEEVQRAAYNTLGGQTDKSAFEIGEALKRNLMTKLDETFSPIKQQYAKIGEEAKSIIVPVPRMEGTARALQGESFMRIKGSSSHNLGTMVHENLSSGAIRNLDDLSVLISNVNSQLKIAQRAGDSQLYRSASIIRNRLQSLEERVITRAGVEARASSLAPQDAIKLAKDAIESRRTVRKSYREFMENLGELGREGRLGKGHDSLQSFINKLDEIPAEKLVQKLWDAKNVRGLKFLQKSFPEEFELLRRYKLKELAQKSTDAVTGEIRVGSLIKNTQDLKMAPEVRKLMFGELGERSLKNLKLINNAIGDRVGPSGTKQAIDYENILSPMKWFKSALRFGAYKGLPRVRAITTAVESQDHKIAERVVHFLKPAGRAIKQVGLGTILDAKDNYRARLEYLSDLTNDPSLMAEKLADETEGLGDVDPEIQDAVNATAVAAVQFLQAKAPKNPGLNTVFGKEDYRPSDQELAKFNRYVKAIDDPMSVLEDLNARVLTPESVEAVRTVFPDIYAKITEKVFETVSKSEKKMSFQDKMQISVLLGMPVNSATDPKFVKQIQDQLTKMQGPITDEGEGGLKPNVGGMKEMNRSGASESPMQKLQNR